MKLKLLVLLLLLMSQYVLAAELKAPVPQSKYGQYTEIAPHTYIYSEYYPNKNSSFKGTIVFENGGGSDLSVWKKALNHETSVLACARKFGSVFIYDRSGIGKSNPDLSISLKSPITAEKTINHLLFVLKQRQARPPYVLVVHSYGGFYGQYFARKYPHLIAGIVFIDPVVVNYHYPKWLLDKLARYHSIAKNHSTDYIYHHYKKSSFSADTLYTLLGYESSTKAINQLPLFNPSMPITIFTSTEMNQSKEKWYEFEKALAKQSKNSKLMVVRSSHYIMRDKPRLICQAMRDIINKSLVD